MRALGELWHLALSTLVVTLVTDYGVAETLFWALWATAGVRIVAAGVLQPINRVRDTAKPVRPSSSELRRVAYERMLVAQLEKDAEWLDTNAQLAQHVSDTMRRVDVVSAPRALDPVYVPQGWRMYSSGRLRPDPSMRGPRA